MKFGTQSSARVGIGRGAAGAALAAVAIATGAGAASAATSAPPQEQPAKMIAGDSRWLVFNQTNSDIHLYDSSKWTTGNYYWTLPSGWTHAGQDSNWGTDLTTWIKFGDGTKVDMEFENAAIGWPSATVDGQSHNYSALERKTYTIKGHTIEIMRNVDTSDGAKDFYVYVKS